MRIDRRVSPNQAALWTVYELVDAQAARILPPPRAAQQRSRSWAGDLGRMLTTVAVYVIAEANSWARSLVARRRGTRQPVMMVRPSCST
jgi:hypothetical protein